MKNHDLKIIKKLLFKHMKTFNQDQLNKYIQIYKSRGEKYLKKKIIADIQSKQIRSAEILNITDKKNITKNNDINRYVNNQIKNWDKSVFTRTNCSTIGE